MTLRTPRWLPEALLLFLVLFGPLAFGAVEPWSLAILEIAAFLMLFCSSAHGFYRLEGPVYQAFLPAVAGVVLIGSLQWLNPHPVAWPQSFAPFTAYAYGTGSALLLWSAYCALLASVPQVLSSRASCRRFTWAVFLVGVIVAVVGIAQRGQGNLAYYGLRTIRVGKPFGPYTNYDHAASLMVMSALIGCGLAIESLLKIRQEPNLGRRSDLVAIQVLLLFALSIVLYGIIQTGSRGGLISLAVSSWVLSLAATEFLSKTALRWTARSALGFAAVAYAVSLWLHPEGIGFGEAASDASTAYRLSMYRSGWRMFKDFPVTGTGLGALLHSFPIYQERLIHGVVDHLHNDWLELLVQTGLAGLLCYAGGVVILSIRTVRQWFSIPSREGRCLIGGALAAAFAFVLHGMVDFSFQIPANAAVFLAIAAFMGSVGRAVSKPPDTDFDDRPRTASTLTKTRAVICALSLCMAWVAIHPVVASWYLRQADQASPPARAFFLAKAISWDADPSHRYRLGLNYLLLAEANPAAKTIFLPEALLHSDLALAQDPQYPQFRYLQACILWRLGRVEDAKRLMP